MDLFSTILLFIALLIGIVFHESAHAWMANKLGDSTAKDLGRISFNPLRHIDPIGTVVLPLMGLFSPSHSFFGWAKPTPYNPSNLKDGIKDEILIALAGPISNFFLAGMFVVLFYASLYPIGIAIGVVEFLFHVTINTHAIAQYISIFFISIIMENLILAFFNLLPLPPLDGSRFLKAILPKNFQTPLLFLNQYGFLILMASSLTPFGNVVGNYLDTCVGFCMKLVGL